ncbi:MAG TPA: Ig-like domain-containing protein [Kineosporiaceae bacterium]
MNDDPILDPELSGTAGRVRTVLHSGGIRPEFSEWLRARLVAEAAERVAASASPVRPHLVPVPDLEPDQVPTPVPTPVGRPEPGPVVPLQRRGRGRRVAAWAATATTAAAATAAVVVGLVPSLLQPGSVLVTASSTLTGAVSADTNAPIRLTFDQALDHASAVAALRLSPATAVRTAWEGDTLLVQPVHGLAANSAYVLTVDARTARTAQGAPLAADLQLAFGTAAGSDGVTAAAGEPASLPRTVMTSASDGSEAVVTRSDSLLVTGARTAAGSSLVRMQEKGDTQRTLGSATDSICVSRSGRSVAYLGRTAKGPGIVFANSEGTAIRTIEASVDPGSPLGWIDDDEVTFVSGGKITAANRQGHQRVLSSQPVDAARQTAVVAPGARYVYLGNSNGTGRLIDLVAGSWQPLNGLVAAPAFTSDGAGMVWVDRSGSSYRVHHGPSNGGAATSAVLPVSSTDRISDLAISPDGTRFVYSVSNLGRAELRLAALPSGVTLAVSAKGVGQSPNFSPTGAFFTVLGSSAGSHRIEMVKIPKVMEVESAAAKLAAARAVATAFALAQVAGDGGAQAWLARSGLNLPQVPRATRAALLWSVPADDGTVTVRVRLTVDPQSQPARPYPLQGEETLTVSPAGSAASGSGVLPKVTAVEVGQFAAAPAGPHVIRVVVNPAGEVGVTFDSDLEAASVSAGIRLTGTNGAVVAATARYDASTRTAWLSPSAAKGTLVRIAVAGVRDMQGTPTASGPLEARLLG